jgi:3-methyladenine DNA glycosylase AlkC
MAEPLKYVYNSTFFDLLSESLIRVYPDFDKDKFTERIFTEQWNELELKDRMHHIATTLRDFLPKEYKKAVNVLLELINFLRENNIKMAFEFMFIPDFVEQYGLDDYDTSINALEKITQFTSSEFAVRPFIIKYPQQMMKQMLIWSKHPHHGVRRFSSEGCRPRLPWAMALPDLKKDPSPVLPILENLKNDPSEFVRKSVANNLNDISKDKTNLVIKITKKWIGQSKNTDWILKHGCRTLLKQAHPEVLELFGLAANDKIIIEAFEIHTPIVKIKECVTFSFQVKNTDNKPHKLRLEYGLYYQKANASLSKKVFKISEKEYPANSTSTINRNQSFKLISTRKFHLGLHQVSIIINGVESEKKDFELV